MLRSLCPARHLTTPRYNFIFHITLPDNATGSVRSLVPGLCDLSIPFKLHATSAPQSSKTRWPGPGLDQPTEIFHAAAQPAKCSGGIKTTCSITQDALGKGKTAPAPPWLRRRSTPINNHKTETIYYLLPGVLTDKQELSPLRG